MEIDLDTSLTRTYVLRFAAKKATKTGYDSLEITVPLEVAQRECRRLGLTLEEFVERYQAVWYMGNYPGLYLTFEEKEKAPIPEASVAPVSAAAAVGQETPNPPSKKGEQGG